MTSQPMNSCGRTWVLGAALLLVGTLSSPDARADRVTILADVGVAPAVHLINGGFDLNKDVQLGLKLSLEGIITREVIQKNKHRVPKKYRRFVERANEFRISPFWYLPDTLFISPKIGESQMYGLSFRPIGLGLAFGRKPRLGLEAGAVLTYAWYQSDAHDDGSGTHFIRPGVEIRVDFEIPFTRTFLLSLGWASTFYVPQEFGGFGFPEEDFLTKSIWHIGQGYLMFHFRFPYTTNI